MEHRELTVKWDRNLGELQRGKSSYLGYVTVTGIPTVKTKDSF